MSWLLREQGMVVGTSKAFSSVLIDEKLLPEVKECTRLRDRERQRKATDAARKKVERAVKKLPCMKCLKLLRTPPSETIHVGARLGSSAVTKSWLPSPGAAVELAFCGGSAIEGWERIIIGVHADAVHPMLAWIAPKLLQCTNAKPAARGSGDASMPRGASIILSFERSSSGPHRDGEDSLLFAVSGTRCIWYAESVPEHLNISQDKAGAPEYLSSEYDPSLHQGCCAQWEQHTLNAGDACWIPRGWWHCVDSEPQSLAVAVEVAHGSVRGTRPRFFRRVAQVKHAGRSLRQVSRRRGWTSAYAMISLWKSSLQHLGV